MPHPTTPTPPTDAEVERVARSIADVDQEDYMEDWKRYDTRARAAIKAMAPQRAAWPEDVESVAEWLGEHVLVPVEFRIGLAQAIIARWGAPPVADGHEWRPIDTAPKDGTVVIVGHAKGAWMAKYEPAYQSGYRPENPWFSLMLNLRHVGKYLSPVPTHWMPLPAPPSTTLPAGTNRVGSGLGDGEYHSGQVVYYDGEDAVVRVIFGGMTDRGALVSLESAPEDGFFVKLSDLSVTPPSSLPISAAPKVEAVDPRIAIVAAQIENVCSDGNSDARRVARDVLAALDASQEIRASFKDALHAAAAEGRKA